MIRSNREELLNLLDVVSVTEFFKTVPIEINSFSNVYCSLCLRQLIVSWLSLR